MLDIAQWLFKPIIVQQQKVVLIPDVVGPVPVSEQHEYVEIETAKNTCPAIYARENDIEQVRSRHADLPVFGIWQTLINSGLISFSKTLQVLTTSEFDGYYLFSDMGRAQYSGVYEAGFFAADTAFDLEEAEHIHFVSEHLIVPEQQAKLAMELQNERQSAFRKSWINCVFACAVLVVSGIGIDFGLHYFYQTETATYALKSSLLGNVRQGLEELQTTRVNEVPNDADLIKKLAELWAVDSAFSLTGQASFKNTHFEGVMTDKGYNPATKLPWLETTYDPAGRWLMRFKR